MVEVVEILEVSLDYVVKVKAADENERAHLYGNNDKHEHNISAVRI